MGHNTGNELPSKDVLDFEDNVENLDRLMNVEEDYWEDRFGNKRPTIDYALRMAGFTPAGFDFATGGVLQPGDRNKCVFNQADQTWYSYNGNLPYNVIAGSAPNSDWKVVSFLNTLVFDTIYDIIATKGLKIGSVVTWLGYHKVGDGGGNSGKVTEGPLIEDNGSVFKLANNLYIKADFNFIEPAKFGVSPLRTAAENAASISAMIEYALTNKKKIQNYVPMDYQCDPIIINGASKDFFYWEAPRGSVTHRCPSQSSPAFLLQGSRTTAFDMNTFQYCTIKGLRIISGYCGIFTRWTEHLHLEKLLFSGTGIGIMQSVNGNLETDVKSRIEGIIFAGCKNAYKGAIPDGKGDEGRVADSIFKDWVALNCGTADGDWVFDFGYLDGSVLDHIETYTDSYNLVKMNGLILRKPNISNIKNCNIFETNGIGIQITSPRNLIMDETNTIWGTGESANDPAVFISKFGSITSSGCQIRPKVKNNYGPALRVTSVGGIDFSGIDESGNCLGNSSLSGMQFQGSDNNVMHFSKHDSSGNFWISLDGSTIEIFGTKVTRYSNDASRVNNGSMVVLPGNNIKKVTSSVTLKTFEDCVHYDATSGSALIYLPNAALCPGKLITVSKTDTSPNNIAVMPLSGTSQLINGQTSRSLLTQFHTEVYRSDGLNWYVISKHQ